MSMEKKLDNLLNTATATPLETINRQIDLKRIERKEKLEAYNKSHNEMRELKLQRERLMYNGMLKHEYISWLGKNPIEHIEDGIKFVVKGYEITAEFDTEEGEHVYFSDTIYKDQNNPRMSLTTAAGRNFVYHSHDCPKSREKFFNRLREITASLKTIEPDEDGDNFY